MRRALLGTAHPNARFFAAAPTRAQAKRIWWQDLKAMVPRRYLSGAPLEGALILPFENGSEIHVLGMDVPARIEGAPWDGGVLDEYGNMKPTTWSEHVRPALSDRLGWCDLIGVPEGRNHYYEAYNRAVAHQIEGGREWAAFTWTSATVLSADEIEQAREDLDDLTFSQEYEASFVSFQGRVYYAFDDENKARLDYDPHAPIAVCLDFNISPGVAGVMQEGVLPNGEVGTKAVGEVYIPHGSNTELVCERIQEDWEDHIGEVWVYGDASGGAGGTAKVKGSDWEIVRRELTAVFGDRLSMRVPRENPPVRSRVNAVNTRLTNAKGRKRFFVDPSRCPNLVRDLEGVRWKEGTNNIEKKKDPMLTHISDAVGYYVARDFPLQSQAAEEHELVGFV